MYGPVKGNLCVLGATLLLAVAASSVARADVHMVTNTEDSGFGSLRHCIEDADPGDEIQFDPSLDGQPIVLTSGQLVIDKDLIITGRGADKTTLDGNHEHRVLLIDGSPGVLLSGVTIRHGFATSGGGGGISNTEGDLNIENSKITENQGAISNGGWRSATLTVRNSTISNNRRGIHSLSGTVSVDSSRIVGNTWRGGIEFSHGDDLTITNSTIAGNQTANRYGASAIGFSGKSLLITNSTISDNGGGQSAIAISCSARKPCPSLRISRSTISGHAEACGVSFSAWEGGTLYIDSTTITDNHRFGIKHLAAPVILRNSIVANQRNHWNNCSGSGWVTSGSHNLSSDITCVDPANPTDQPNTDPMLGPLQDNGGPTWTHDPLKGSPVIDRGQCIEPGTDQRGAPLPLDGDRDGVRICDIGAVEYSPTKIRRIDAGGNDADIE